MDNLENVYKNHAIPEIQQLGLDYIYLALFSDLNIRDYSRHKFIHLNWKAQF